MSGELAVRYTANDGTEIALDADSVRKYHVTGSGQVSDQEAAGFMAVCRARGLNPLARDAYLIKYDGRAPAAVVTSKDYFVATASRKETFEGFEAGVVVVGGDGRVVERQGSMLLAGETLVGGWARVSDSRRKVPYYESVSLSEYSTGRSGWARMPGTMIRKVALVHALREAYPSSFSGLYDRDEMDQASASPLPVEPVAVEPCAPVCATAEAVPVYEPGPVPEAPQEPPREPLTARQKARGASIVQAAADRTGWDQARARAALFAEAGRPPVAAAEFDAWADRAAQALQRLAEAANPARAAGMEVVAGGGLD